MTTVGLPPRDDFATDPMSVEDAKDDELINGLLGGNPLETSMDGNLSFGDTTGKVDDAVDYEDISDDDLPSEDEATNKAGDVGNDDGGDILADLAKQEGEDDAMGEYDDLFGEMEPMSDPAAPAADLNITINGDMSFDFDHRTATGDDDDDLFKGFDFGNEMAMPQPEQAQQHNFSNEELAMQYFPTFKPNSPLSFISLFLNKTASLQTAPQKVPKVCVPTKINIEMALDDENTFGKKGMPAAVEKPVVEIPPLADLMDLEEQETEQETNESMDPVAERDLEIACDDWESKIEAAMITPPSSPPLAPQRQLHEEDVDEDFEIEDRSPKRLKLENRYIDILPESWLDEEAILNGDLSSLGSKVILDLNDPHLLIDIRQPNEISRKRRIGGEFKRRVNRDLTQRYNISNDEAYDLLKENHQNKVRSTLGQLNIEHSMPALRLQTPYYKTKLSTKEARSFHRPTLHFHVDQEIRFSKMKTRKRKTFRGKDIKDVLATTKDVSLSDGLDFILLEYSEEYPFVMSNFGMGSRLINYYRRKSPDDDSRPKYDIGETQVLMSQDRSPFWNFGTVDPGETVPTLYNKMVRAPIFKQNPKNTDFLVIRNTHENQSHYYLRTIPYMYVVGQLFPVTDVPGPHSRKVTTAAKNRLKMICYRVVKRKSGHAIAVKDISSHFPENNDMQNRQKMKEFMAYQKNSGLWEMKSGEVIPDESSIRSMIKPEDLCLLEAMQVGVRNLEDSGYAKTVEDEDEEGKDGMSLEQQLTPWVSTKNFLNATQGKAMLQLHGEGDPSGRGEAFSFVRTSMKGGFKDIGESIDEKMDKQRLKELGGHSYNVARQQKQYEEAIDRIWRAQYTSLSSTEENHELDMDDAQEEQHPADDLFEDMRTPRSEASPWVNADDETTSQFSRMSAKMQGNKVLKITRKVRNEDGSLVSKVEVIRDPKVIRQYVQRRRELEAEKIGIESLVPTGNAEEDEHAKKRLIIELARLQRNRERREARERQGGKRGASDAMSPDPTTPGSPMVPAIPIGKQATTRKCANCGQAGHIRTNKKLCPKLNGQWQELGMSPPAAPTPT